MLVVLQVWSDLKLLDYMSEITQLIQIYGGGRGNIHDLFCMVLQYRWLFKCKIRGNLIYNQKYVSDEVIKKARKAVGLDHFIETLNDGYDTILNDKVNLSVGKK